MKITSDKTQALRRMQEKARAGGGSERMKARAKTGRLSARERIEHLLDEDSFEEIDLLRKTRARDFGMAEKDVPADGVVTGFGKIRGRSVAVYSQDFTVLGIASRSAR